MSVEPETRVNDPIIIRADDEMTHTCVVCNTRKCDFSRHLPFCGPICEYCFNKIGDFKRIVETKRRLLKYVPSDAAKKVERNIRKLERKIKRMTTIDDTEINKLLGERDNATKT